MTAPDDLRYTKMTLNNGSGAIPALGFGTLIPDPVATKNATKVALEAGFRVIDTAERYRTEREVGEAMQEVFKGGRSSGRTFLLSRSSGTQIIVLNASNPPARPVSRNSNSTSSISISSTPPSLSNPETSKILEMQTAT
jgi:hypothetical protein